MNKYVLLFKGVKSKLVPSIANCLPLTFLPNRIPIWLREATGPVKKYSLSQLGVMV